MNFHKFSEDHKPVGRNHKVPDIQISTQFVSSDYKAKEPQKQFTEKISAKNFPERGKGSFLQQIWSPKTSPAKDQLDYDDPNSLFYGAAQKQQQEFERINQKLIENRQLLKKQKREKERGQLQSPEINVVRRPPKLVQQPQEDFSFDDVDIPGSPKEAESVNIIHDNYVGTKGTLKAAKTKAQQIYNSNSRMTLKNKSSKPPSFGKIVKQRKELNKTHESQEAKRCVSPVFKVKKVKSPGAADLSKVYTEVSMISDRSHVINQPKVKKPIYSKQKYVPRKGENDSPEAPTMTVKSAVSVMNIGNAPTENHPDGQQLPSAVTVTQLDKVNQESPNKKKLTLDEHLFNNHIDEEVMHEDLTPIMDNKDPSQSFSQQPSAFIESNRPQKSPKQLRDNNLDQQIQEAREITDTVQTIEDEEADLMLAEGAKQMLANRAAALDKQNMSHQNGENGEQLSLYQNLNQTSFKGSMRDIEEYGFEQYQLGQEKLRQTKEKIHEENKKKIQELEEQMTIKIEQKEQAKQDAERKVVEMREELDKQIEDNVQKKVSQIDRQYQLEKQQLLDQMDSMKGSYLDLRTNLYKNEQIRKIQQQQILHLKGNMRVFCRVKPILAGESSFKEDIPGISMFDQDLITFPQLAIDEHTQNKQKTHHQCLELNLPRIQGPIVYNFDQVFPPDTQQNEIFEEIKPFIQTALDGENTCIFAYGQTGSGKTFTMEGPNQDLNFDMETGQPLKMSGILPRVACFIWKEIERYQKHFGLGIFIEVSALEIYCENIRDLLNESAPKDKVKPYIDIKTIGNKVHCIGQTWVRVDSPEHFLQQIVISRSKRVFKANGVHPNSSRSHHIFQIRINSSNRAGRPHKSLLNIVDLAGSERRNNFYQETERRVSVSGNLASSRNSIKIRQSSLKQEFESIQSKQSRQSIKVDPLVYSQQGELRQHIISQTPKGKMNKRVSLKATSAVSKFGVKSGVKGSRSKSKSFKQLEPFITNSLAIKRNEIQNLNDGFKIYDLETESKFINKNLTTLGRVFSILSNRKLQNKKMPPYRECKLTRLLQNSLQYDNCKTVMILNVQMNMKSHQITKESLEFAQKAMIAF